MRQAIRQSGSRVARWIWQRSVLNGLSIDEDVPYGDHPFQKMDVIHPPPEARNGFGVVHIHGGAFRMMSKETHGYAVGQYASAGFTVFNLNYRLAPEFRCPAAVEDVHQAWNFIVDNAERWNAHAERLLLSGESAGANLALGLAISCSLSHDSPWAKLSHARGKRPVALHTSYGFLQASDTDRYRRRRMVSRFVATRMQDIEQDYLDGGQHPYSDPLCIVEDAAPEHIRSLPPILAMCGTQDVIAADTERLIRAVRRAGGTIEEAWVPGARHGFHLAPGPQSAEAWRAILRHAKRVTT